MSLRWEVGLGSGLLTIATLLPSLERHGRLKLD
jgi:hypothetical protein